jgi:hypothetical protein
MQDCISLLEKHHNPHFISIVTGFMRLKAYYNLMAAMYQASWVGYDEDEDEAICHQL